MPCIACSQATNSDGPYPGLTKCIHEMPVMMGSFYRLEEKVDRILKMLEAKQ